MRKIVRNVIAILLSVTGLILLVIPSQSLQAVSNQGDFTMDGTTLVKYNGHQADLTLPDFITTIGKDAFSANVSLRSIVIPKAVKTIDYAAFEKCTNLQSVSIPESVRTIGSSAFSGCTSLRNITIPHKVDSIGSGAFAGCTSLSSVSVSNQNKNFICQDGVIYSADGKKLVQYLAGRPSTTYTFPNSIEKIDEYAFWGASNLTGVSISPNVTEIPEYAFSNCPGLSTVVIPNSVSKIMAYAFSDCVNLQTAIIPKSVGYIDDLAFYMSNGVKVQFVDSTAGVSTTPVSSSSSVTTTNNTDSSDNNGSVEGDTNNSEPFIDESYYPVIADYEENIIPGEMGSTKIVGSKAVLIMSPSMTVKESYNLNNAEIEDGISKNINNTRKEDEFSIIRSVLDVYNGNSDNITIPGEVEKIGNRCFYNKADVKSVSIPSSVTEIGDFAFARSGLTSINIPGSVNKIGYAAFYQCPDLEEINIPDSVEYIELGAFLGTPYLTNWQMTDDSDNYLIVGDHILLSYKGEGGNVTIPEGTKAIAPGCFIGNTSITGVSIPGSVKTIGEDAFNGCTSLDTLSLSSGIENIEDRAFKNTNLSTLSIPPTVTSIGLGAFDILDSAPLETALFMGTTLPNVSYKPTASRLSADDLRTLSFDGIDNAVIRDTADINSGTIFDSNHLGFRGSVYTISGSNDKGSSTLNLVKCNKEPDDSGVVEINSHVNIGKTEYLMAGVHQGAFNDYKNIGSWCEKPLIDVRIAGNTSDEVGSILDSISQNEATVYNEDNAITVNDNRTQKGNGSLSAVIKGNTEHFILNINDADENKELFASAFINSLGKVINGNVNCYDITMTDKSGTVPISKLNKSKIEITLPVPENMKGSNDIMVMSLNDNGALETISTAPVSDENGESIKFVTGHFSPFALCHASALYAATNEEDVNETADTEALINDSDEYDELTVLNAEITQSQDVFNLNAKSGSLNNHYGIFSPLKILSLVLLLSGIILFIFNIFSAKNKKY